MAYMDMTTAPKPGQIVEYTLNEYDAALIRERRGEDGNSAQGNSVDAGDVYPMVIVRAWGSTPASAVNGQVLLDGRDTHWATSRTQGTGPGHWQPYDA